MIGKTETHTRVYKRDKKRLKKFAKDRHLTSSQAFRLILKRGGLF